ncbi:MAG: TetR/AcrR family transcriptional regulator, partial [Duodenibacillus sp.]
MTQSTRDAVLEAAVDLFAQHGFEAASMQNIAQTVGVTKAALYKHFKSKAAILDVLADRMAALDAERAAAFDLPIQSKKDSPRAYRRASLENLARFALAQFDFWTADPFASRFRRMLVHEQWHSGRMQDLWRQHF